MPAPSPDGRCADALSPLRQRWRPLRSLRAASGARHGGAGKLSNRKRILEIACRSTSYATPSVLFAPSSLRSFPLVHLRYAPHRHHRPSPYSTPRLDRCICVKGERCCRMRSNPRAEFPRTRQRFYRAMEVALRIPRGREGARTKRASARWGVCKAPTGASPRTPQTSAAQPFCIGNPLQTGKFCSRDPCRCTKFACKSNFYA